MILSNSQIINGELKTITIGEKIFKYLIEGIIFVPGKKMNEESISFIIEQLLLEHNKNVFNSIYGNYFLLIQDNDTSYFFIDNANIFPAFNYNSTIATSFLELIKFDSKITTENINNDAIMDFFHLGSPHFNGTFINGINKISGDIYFVHKNGTLKSYSKNIPDIDAPPSTDFDTFFENLFYAIKDQNLSIDLTGGTDSRLILSFLLKSQLKFDVQTNGPKGNSDFALAKNISDKFQLKHYFSIHSVDEISENELFEIFNFTDAQMDVLRYHSTYQANSKRNLRNIELAINGIGGGLYKEFYWIQDFPFYNKKKTNVSKLYDLRIRGIAFPLNVLGPKLTEYGKTYRNKIITKLEGLTKDTNTQSFDNILYKFKATNSAGHYIGANKWFNDYSVLLEPDLVRIGYGLNRGMRFFSRYHRKLITQNSPLLSKLKTNGGLTASFLNRYMVLDSIFYIFDKAKRLLKQILRKLLRKNYFNKVDVNKDIYDRYRQTSYFLKNLELLKSLGFINKNLNKDKVPNEMVGKVLTLGMFISFLKEVTNKK